jgi:hypothetical protein
MAIDRQAREARLDRLDSILGIKEKTEQLLAEADMHYNKGGARKAKASFRVKVNNEDAVFIRSFSTTELAKAIESVAGRYAILALCYDGLVKRPGIFRLVRFSLVVYASLW